MTQFWLGIERLIMDHRQWMYLIIALGVIGCGIMLSLPSDKLNDKAKGHIPKIIVGAGLIVLATEFAHYVISVFGG